MDVMSVFGFIMLLCTFQLIFVGSVIQRGKENWIPSVLKRNVKNMSMYCRYTGNRIILLGLISGVCSWISYHTLEVSMQPVIVFGFGIIIVLVLMMLDHNRFSK